MNRLRLNFSEEPFMFIAIYLIVFTVIGGAAVTAIYDRLIGDRSL